MIDAAVVEKIRRDVSLLELCRADGMEFRREGGDWFARCPFHDEKSGSFKVNEQRNAYKCFGCPAKGDVIAYYLARRGLDPKRGFPDAIRALGARAGIMVEHSGKAFERRPQRPKRTREQIEQEKQERIALALAERARMAMEAILREYAWTVADLTQESPVQVDPEDGRAQARALLGLFDPEDVVWTGEVKHSIAKEDDREMPPEDWKWGVTRWQEWRAEVRGHFRRAADWMGRMDEVSPGPRICGCVFKPGLVSRSLESVARERFLVIEHDKLNLDAQASLLRWLWQRARLNLRAVVFTGGKSLHGWYDAPLPHERARLRVMLCGITEQIVVDGRGKNVTRGGLGFDSATFNPVQPWKLPGWPHPKTGVPAQLLWMGGKS